MATLVMTSWIIKNHNAPLKKDEDDDEQQDYSKKKKKSEPPPPPDLRLNPFGFDRRENNPIGDHCYLTPPEYGVDTHEAWDRGLVTLCNMSGLTPLQAASLFEEEPASSFVQIREPWLPPGLWDQTAA